MRVLLVLLCLAVALSAVPAVAQPDIPGGELDEAMRHMEPGPAMLLRLLAQGDMDPMMMFLLIGMMEGGVDEDIMFPMLLSSLAKAGRAAPAPATVLKGNTLLIVEDGTVYKVDVGQMELAGTVTYRPKAEKADPLQAILPMIFGVRGAPVAEVEEMGATEWREAVAEEVEEEAGRRDEAAEEGEAEEEAEEE